MSQTMQSTAVKQCLMFHIQTKTVENTLFSTLTQDMTYVQTQTYLSTATQFETATQTDFQTETEMVTVTQVSTLVQPTTYISTYVSTSVVDEVRIDVGADSFMLTPK